MDIETIILRIRKAIALNVSVEEIHDRVIKSGVDEGTFYLCYQAANILLLS